MAILFAGDLPVISTEDGSSTLSCEVFRDSYWWNSPDTPPLVGAQPQFSMSKRGRKLLRTILPGDGSLLRLGDPLQLGTEEGFVTNINNPRTIVKVVAEQLNRSHGFDSHSPDMISTVEENGYQLVAIQSPCLGINARYSREVIWMAVAETTKGQNALFPIAVNQEHSYGSGLNERYCTSLKISQIATKSSMSVANMDQTRVLSDASAELYIRNLTTTLYATEPPVRGDLWHL